MAIALPGEDGLPPGPRRELVRFLHEMYERAGRPASRVISQVAFRDETLETVSHETVSSALRGGSIPSWSKVRTVVTVLARLAGDSDAATLDHLRRINTLWIAATRVPEPNAPAAQVPAEPISVPRPTENAQPAPGPLLDLGDPPRPDPAFTGREDLLAVLRDRLSGESAPAVVVLHGIAGAGKSTLAREYIDRFRDRHDEIWWIPAEAQRRAGWIDLLRELPSLPPGVLLVVDGAREAADVGRAFPATGADLMITSRDPRWASLLGGTGIEVPELDGAEALQLLRKYDRSVSPAVAGEVLDRLGREPRALAELASLRRDTARPWRELLELFNPAGTTTALLAVRRDIERLRADNPDAMAVLDLFALAGEHPPADQEVAEWASERGHRELADPIRYRRAIGDIVTHGLGRLNLEGGTLELPILVRDERLRSMPDTQRRELADLVAAGPVHEPPVVAPATPVAGTPAPVGPPPAMRTGWRGRWGLLRHSARRAWQPMRPEPFDLDQAVAEVEAEIERVMAELGPPPGRARGGPDG